MRKWIAGVVLVLTTVLVIGPLGAGAQQTPYEPNKTSLDQHQAPQWFKDAKFGIFIHWGPYSVPAYAPAPDNIPVGGFPYTFNLQYAEWYWRNSMIPGAPSWVHHRDTYGPDKVYDDFIDEWQAERFDPNAWVELFKDAGAKYFVLTSKHHDGFALFDSQTTQRDAVDNGPRRDLVGDLFNAARAQGGIRPALYYSVYEWYHPAYKGINDSGMTLFNGPATAPYNPFYPDPTNQPSGFRAVPYKGYTEVDNYVDDQLLPQMREIIDQYNPELIWCDGGWDNSVDYWKLHETMAYYYNKNQQQGREVVINDRCGNNSHKDYDTAEYTSETAAKEFKWEATRGIGLSFGFNEEEERTGYNYLSSNELIDFLIDVVSKNGNVLLNIGPKADGTIPSSMQQRLRDMGAWLRINGEAIYGSTFHNPAADGNLRFTVKPDAFYMTSLEWPGETLTVPASANAPLKDDSQIFLLGYDQPLSYTKNSDGSFVVQMPPQGRSATPSEHAFTFKITAPAQPPIPTQTPTSEPTTAPTQTPTNGPSNPPTPTSTPVATTTPADFKLYLPLVRR